MSEKELVNLGKNKILRSKNIEYNGSPLNDFLGAIIESGSNDNGYWIKLFDGTLVQYGKKIITIKIKNKSGTSGFYYDDGYLITFPLEFIDKNIFATVITNTDKLTSLNVYSIVPITESYCKFNLSSNIEYSSDNYEFSWLAIGKWK